jgi:hypothetical protein
MIRTWARLSAALWLLTHLALVADAVAELGVLRERVADLTGRLDAYDRAWGAMLRPAPAAARRLRSVPDRRQAG